MSQAHSPSSKINGTQGESQIESLTKGSGPSRSIESSSSLPPPPIIQENTGNTSYRAFTPTVATSHTRRRSSNHSTIEQTLGSGPSRSIESSSSLPPPPIIQENTGNTSYRAFTPTVATSHTRRRSANHSTIEQTLESTYLIQQPIMSHGEPPEFRYSTSTPNFDSYAIDTPENLKHSLSLSILDQTNYEIGASADSIFKKEPAVPVDSDKPIYELDQILVNLNNPRQPPAVYGRVDDKGELEIIPTQTNITQTYIWEIEKQDFVSNNKLVSLPFGPKECIYPNGVGDAKSRFISAFLRPIKNETEILLHDWFRPVSNFKFKILTKNGVFKQESCDDDFNGFSEEHPGYGFLEYCQLPLPLEQLIDGDKLRFEMEVVGKMNVTTSVLSYTENLYVQQDGLLETRAFGPVGSEWVLKFARSNSNFLSAKLYSTDYSFTKVMSMLSVTVKSNQNELLGTKTKTGSENVDFENGAGWESFIEESLVQNGVIVDIKICYDPSSMCGFTQIGKYAQAYQELQQYAQNVEFERDGYYNQQVEAGNSVNAFAAERYDVNRQNETLYVELEALREQNKQLKVALSANGNNHNFYQTVDVKLMETKKRLAKLRLDMDKDIISPTKNKDDLETQLFNVKQEYTTLFHDKATIELKLTQTKAELDFVTRNTSKLTLDIPKSPENNLEESLDMARKEIATAQITIDEINRQNSIYDQMTRMEIESWKADISIVQAALDIANSKLMGVQENEIPVDRWEEYQSVCWEMGNVLQEFMECALSFRRFSFRSGEGNGVGYNAQTTEGGVQAKQSNLFPMIQANMAPMTQSNVLPMIQANMAPPNKTDFSPSDKVISAIQTQITQLTSMIQNPSTPKTSKQFDPIQWAASLESWSTPTEQDQELEQVHAIVMKMHKKQSQSSMFVVCDPLRSTPHLFSNQEVCTKVIVPGFEAVGKGWHKVSELVVLDYVPRTFKGARAVVKRLQGFTRRSVLDPVVRNSTGGDSDSVESVHAVELNHKTTVEKVGKGVKEFVKTEAVEEVEVVTNEHVAIVTSEPEEVLAEKEEVITSSVEIVESEDLKVIPTELGTGIADDKDELAITHHTIVDHDEIYQLTAEQAVFRESMERAAEDLSLPIYDEEQPVEQVEIKAADGVKVELSNEAEIERVELETGAELEKSKFVSDETFEEKDDAALELEQVDFEIETTVKIERPSQETNVVVEGLSSEILDEEKPQIITESTDEEQLIAEELDLGLLDLASHEESPELSYEEVDGEVFFEETQDPAEEGVVVEHTVVKDEL